MDTIHLGYAAIFLYRTDDYGTQILLQKKDRGWRGKDFWTPFGGQIKQGETPIQCIVREVQEELGIKIDTEKLELISEGSTTTKDELVVPLYAFTTYFPWPISEISLDEGCGFAFWYSDELPSVCMQPHEKQIAEEVVKATRIKPRLATLL